MWKILRFWKHKYDVKGSMKCWCHLWKESIGECLLPYIIDIRHPCYGHYWQLSTRYSMASMTWPYCELSFRALVGLITITWNLNIEDLNTVMKVCRTRPNSKHVTWLPTLDSILGPAALARFPKQRLTLVIEPSGAPRCVFQQRFV